MNLVERELGKPKEMNVSIIHMGLAQAVSLVCFLYQVLNAGLEFLYHEYEPVTFLCHQGLLTGRKKYFYAPGGRGKEGAYLRSLKGLEKNGVSLSQVSVLLLIHYFK